MFLYKSTVLRKNHCFRWLQLCVKLCPAFIQIIVKNRYLFPLRKIYSNQLFLRLYAQFLLFFGKLQLPHQILQRLSNFHFTYQIIKCLYTLGNYRFYSNVISSTGEVFNQLDRAVHHNLKSKGAEKMPSVAKKRLYAKNSNVTIYVLTRN